MNYVTMKLYINEIDGRTQLFSIFANGVKVITIEYDYKASTHIEIKYNSKGGNTLIVATTDYLITEEGTMAIGSTEDVFVETERNLSNGTTYKIKTDNYTAENGVYIIGE